MTAGFEERYAASLLGIFGSPQRVLVRGNGCSVWDADGRQYLDLLAGIAVNSLGHAHPALIAAVTAQLATLGHVSNFFATPPQIELAEKLLSITAAPPGSKVFFANSGTEANEAAFKLARRNQTPQRNRILALEGAFHGRTMGALALTAKEAYRQPFEPLPAGVQHLPFGDRHALATAVDSTVAAVVLEPIQGEAGVRPLPDGYLRLARELCTRAGALLIVDEVQTGMGRTGSWLASTGTESDTGEAGTESDTAHRDGVQPDAVTLAKGLGGGFPIGALITFGEDVSSLLTAGQHGTTFGGNPVAAAAAMATIDTIETQGLLARVAKLGSGIRRDLAAVPGVVDVRGRGLLIGCDLDADIAPRAVGRALEAGFIVNATGPRTLRLAPPLIIEETQLRSFSVALPVILAAARAESDATNARNRHHEQQAEKDKS